MVNDKLRIIIKKRLLDLNMTQVDLAEKMGVSRQHLNNVLSGRVEHLKMQEYLENFACNGFELEMRVSIHDT